jgi:hypothetical protein
MSELQINANLSADFMANLTPKRTIASGRFDALISEVVDIEAHSLSDFLVALAELLSIYLVDRICL